MKTIISSHCLVVVSLILSLALVSAQTSDLISQTCSRSEVLYKDLCEKTLRADPASQSADIHGLVKISLNATVKDSSTVRVQIENLLKSSSGDLKPALIDCSNEYADGRDSLDQSEVAARQRKYGDFNIYVSAAMTDADSCEDGFDKGSSPLTEANQNFGHLCSNSLAIGNIASTS